MRLAGLDAITAPDSDREWLREKPQLPRSDIQQNRSATYRRTTPCRYCGPEVHSLRGSLSAERQGRTFLRGWRTLRVGRRSVGAADCHLLAVAAAGPLRINSSIALLILSVLRLVRGVSRETRRLDHQGVPRVSRGTERGMPYGLLMLDPVHHLNFLLLITTIGVAVKPEDITATKGLRPNDSIEAVRNSRGEPAIPPRPISPSGVCGTREELTAPISLLLRLNSKIGLRRSTQLRETATANGASLLVVGKTAWRSPGRWRSYDRARPELRMKLLHASGCKH